MKPPISNPRRNVAAALLAGCGLCFSLTAWAAEPIRLLVITGGHDFQTNEFFQMFTDNREVTARSVIHPDAHAWLRPDKARDYDVIVLYDMWQDIGDQAKTDLRDRVREGKGLVALHHSLASYQQWPEYARLIGGTYHLAPWTSGGKEQPASTYLHDVDFKVRIAKPDHPVVAGLADFDIHDETYGGFEVKPDSVPLLKTEERTSGPVIAWCRTEGASRIVYIQLGHDRQAFENPNYRRLLGNAIRWAARS